MAYNKFLLAACLLTASGVQALPFNQDMVGKQPVTGSIMRPKAPGSVPRGALSRYSEKPEDLTKTLQITNPTNPDASSLASGERLFSINCSPCHGSYVDGKHAPSPMQVPNGAMPGPILSDAIIAQKPDGHFYQFIHFGGMAIMPPYGYKLSVQEHWDIVNYIRDFQRKAGSSPK